jgi:toxin ParE1/3/4
MAGRRGTAIWSPEALADLDEIWSYYERVAGSNTQKTVFPEISEVVTTVEDHPFAGRSRIELRAGFRSLAAGPHVVALDALRKGTPDSM